MLFTISVTTNCIDFGHIIVYRANRGPIYSGLGIQSASAVTPVISDI